MTRQPSGRRPDVATAAIIGLTIATTVVVATTAGASGVAARAPIAVHDIAVHDIAVHDITVGGHPNSVAVDPARHAVWVATPQLIRISEVTKKIVARVRGIDAGAVAVDAGTGTVWAIDDANGSLDEVSEATNRVIHRFAGLAGPAIAIDPVRHAVWLIGNSSVVEFSEATHRILHTVKLHTDRFQRIDALSVDPRTGTVWATIVPGGPGSIHTWISEISEATHRVVHVYPYSGPFNYTAVTAADPANGTVWVSIGNGGGPTGPTGIVEVIDIATHHVVRIISDSLVDPGGLAIDPGAHLVLATARTGNEGLVLLMSSSSGKVIRQVRVGFLPAGVAVDPGTSNVYVPIFFRGVVAQFRD